MSRAPTHRRPEISTLVKPGSVSRTDTGLPTATVPKRVDLPKDPKNPFDEDDDSGGAYDEAKNPFADDPEPKLVKGAAGDGAGDKNNPFDEYDNNLNPFS